MKLIIQIPCYNEEESLEITYNDLPKSIPGIDIIETLIIDDGSTDKTLAVAEQIGINHVVSFKQNKGLAYAFSAGIEGCLKLGADIIVNTDADNQYSGEDIEKLVEPIINNKADVVVGDRQTSNIKHFSIFKKTLQKAGSFMIRQLSGTNVKDAVSGFRAYSRDAAFQINVLSSFSYTIENLIQFGNQKIHIVSVPIRTNKKLRESRLFKSIPNFITNQLKTIFRTYATYKALTFFSTIGIALVLPGLFFIFRFLVFYLNGDGSGHIQSLVISAVLINIGFLVFIIGIIADLIGNNRKLLEKILYKVRKLEMNEKN